MLSVLKIGGSVLRDSETFEHAASFINERLTSNPDERLVIIVSAQQGVTDALLEEARAIATHPNDEALDLLWSTGELRSVATLGLFLQRFGVRAEVLNVHQTGLCWEQDGTSVRPLRILATLARARVAIVPGFLAVRPGGSIRSLGRGGSDLTAVLVATALGASRCELIKDVAGYYTADPHLRPEAEQIRHLSVVLALEMARAGCDLVQREALEAAQRAGLTLTVRSLDADAPLTRVHASCCAPAEAAAFG